jgi:DNA invertase Pin-like site-specific DNA recombinase
MARDDYETLVSLGFTDTDLQDLGLWEVASGPAEILAEAYIRRSNKRDDVTTLRAHVRDLVRRSREHGRTIRHVWFEQRSASKASVKREQFDGACKAILDGKSKTLYVWKTDRLSRRGMGQVGLLLDEFEARNAGIVSVTESLDSRHGSRMVFAILSERAREEAKDIALRTKIGGDAHKAEGRWPGGVCPFGLMSVPGSGKLSRNPAEYPLARRIAEMLLKGTTPTKVAAKLNAEGERTRSGKMWTAPGIINMAHSIGWAGLVPLRERQKDEHGRTTEKWHRGGEPLIGADGHPVECGEGVITYAERGKILALFAGRSVPGTRMGDRTRGKRQAVTVLTGGILVCGKCKGAMGNGGKNYRCLARIFKGPAACGGIATDRDRMDAMIEGMWLNHILMVGPESDTVHEIARRWLNYQDPTKEARKAAVTAALETAASRELRLQKEFFLGGERMTEDVFDALRAELAGQIAGLKAELAELAKTADLSPLMDAEWLAALWEAEGIEGRQALLSAAIRRITVLPAKYRGDRTPLSERLEVDWRDKTSQGPDVAAALAFVDRVRERRAAALAGA